MTTESVPAALIDAYRGIAASTIGHVLQEGHIHGLPPLVADVHIVGRVTTAQIHAPDGGVLRDALIASQPGDVLIVANSGEANCACWGELRTLAARIKGLAGVVIDGPVGLLPLESFCCRLLPAVRRTPIADSACHHRRLRPGLSERRHPSQRSIGSRLNRS